MKIKEVPTINEKMIYSDNDPKENLPDFGLLHHYFKLNNNHSLLAPESVRNAYIEYLQREEQGEIMEDEDLRESVIKYLKMNSIVQKPTKEEPTQDVVLRIEALKIAYDTAHKLGGFSTMRVYNMENSTESLENDLMDVFKLADINIKYLLNRHEES